MAEERTARSRGRIRITLLASVTAALVALAVAQLVPSGTAAIPPARTSRTGHTGVLGFTDATMTAARTGGSSAITLGISNGTGASFNLLGISSPIARFNSLHYDQNMCGANSIMVKIPDIEIPSGRALSLGLRGTGAMLMRFDRSVRKGSRIPLSVHWQDAEGRTHTSQVQALVVAPPGRIYWGSMSMQM